MLICPNCGNELKKEANSYKCLKGHSFDISSRGYVNLLIKHSANPGDSNESVLSRDVFLNHGYYSGLAEDLRDTIKKYMQPRQQFLDAGTGTGYYLKYLTDSIDLDYYATDISKKAVDLSCRKNKQVICFVGNVFHLPFSDSSLDGLMSVFTPYSSEEFFRVIKKGGYVFAVTPGAKHLYQLKEIVYPTPYLNDESGYDLPGFELVEKHNVTYPIELTNNEDINSLWKMMPYYHTTSKENNDKLLSRQQASTYVDFLVSVYKKVDD